MRTVDEETPDEMILHSVSLITLSDLLSCHAIVIFTVINQSNSIVAMARGRQHDCLLEQSEASRRELTKGVLSASVQNASSPCLKSGSLFSQNATWSPLLCSKHCDWYFSASDFCLALKTIAPVFFQRLAL